MYSKEELEFINYWKANRLKRKRTFRQILIGLPVGLVIVVAIFLNFFSGWYKRANMVANADPGLFLILFISGLLIVAFIAIFSSYHKWDMGEMRYKELQARENSIEKNRNNHK